MSSNNRDKTLLGYNMDDIIHSYNAFAKHFVLGDQLLKGAQGTIYATRSKNKNKFSMITKSIKCGEGEFAEEIKNKSVLEYILMRKLNLIHYNGISYGSYNKDKILLTMEMMEYSLSDAIYFNLDEDIHDFKCLKSDHGLKYFILEVTGFLYQIHNAGFVHLDIKPDNIMFRNHKNEHKLFYGNGFKIIDLGLAEYIGSANKIKLDCFIGTVGYTAPEIDPLININKETELDTKQYNIIDYKADIWSLGVVILYVLNGYNIFDVKGKDKLDIYRRYKNKLDKNNGLIDTHLMDLYLNNKISFKLYDLLCQLFEYDADKRPSTKSILQHSLFDGIVFQGINGEFYCYRNQQRKISRGNKIERFVPLTQKIRVRNKT